MEKNVRLLIVCGTGIATSTAAEYKIKEWFEKRNYNLKTTCCIASEVNAKAKSFNPHAIITTTKIKLVKIETENGETKHEVDGIPDIPAFNGVPFLTGIAEEELVDRICKSIDASDKR
ncbi:MAG: hypothetical protein Q7J07_02960 [Pelolinea sp.]|nr:hypothetical protein [Pelolinea sp.]